ncbi:MAG: MATE family efflux transporter [Methanomicrobia archaeon]|nr:MATE family efflux transporter [Methanomicrobia archaeon]
MQDLTSGSIRKNVLYLAWPAVVTMLLQMVVGIADIAMVGRLGANELAAVGLGRQIIFLFYGLIFGVSIGTTALIARYIGAKDKEKAVLVGEQSLIFGMILSLIIGITGFFYADTFIKILGPEPIIVSIGYDYLQIMFFGLFTVFITFIINGIFRGIGDTKTPMYLMAFINVLNVILNYFLIFGIWKFPFLGVKGAAIATVVSRGLGIIIGFYLLYSGKKGIKLRLHSQIDFSVIKKIIRIGLPASGENLIYTSAGIFYTMIVVSFGTTAIAAHQVALRSESFSFMPGFGFAIAATTLVGQNLGAVKPQRAEKSAYESLRLALIVMGVMGILFFIFPEYFVKIFTNDPDVIKFAVPCLRIIAISEPALAIMFVLAGSLRGAGDTMYPMIIAGVSHWLLRLPLAYLFGVVMEGGLIGAWIAMTLETIAGGLLFYIRFKKGKWKKIKV